MLTQLFNSFFITTRQSKYLIYGSLAATIVNIVLDYLLIFGKAGMPALGLIGAAIASAIAEFVYCIVMAGLFYFRRQYKHHHVRSFLYFDTELSLRSLTISSPLIVQFLFSIGGWQVFFIFVEHLGQQELAASQILRSVFGIVSVGTWALSSACNSIVSNLIGQGKRREVIPVIWKISKLSLTYAILVCIPLLLFSSEFLSVYRDEPSLIALAVPSLRVIVLATLIMSISTTMFNGVLGTGNTRMNLIIEVICVCTYLVYCYFVIEVNRMSLTWAWASEFVYWTSLVLMSYSYLKSGRWKGKTI
jgi:Na+-driven multidrug efflux pump